MRWIFLVAPCSFTLEKIIERCVADHKCSVYGPWNWGIYILPMGTSHNLNFLNSHNPRYVRFEFYSLDELVKESEYDETYLRLKEVCDIAYLIKWDNDEFLRSILKTFSNEPNIFIDNEHELILPVLEFLEWWRLNPYASVG